MPPSPRHSPTSPAALAALAARRRGLDSLLGQVRAEQARLRLSPAYAAGPGLLLSETLAGGGRGGRGDHDQATSSGTTDAERTRLIALVEQAREGDAEAFGALYDHYHVRVYRFLYARTRSVPLAEDLTGDTFVRALRNISHFQWQGRDFGAWLMTIARNLATDHAKASRTRLESPTDDLGAHGVTTPGPETEVLAGITRDLVLEALGRLPVEQRDCLTMRFLQSMSIAETAAALGRTEGAVKQLQLRAVRRLATLVPEGIGP